MRISKGKPVFGRGETFSLDDTLAPIIASGIKRFKQVITDNPYGGFPISMFEEMGVEDYNNTTEEQDEQAKQLWHDHLDKMIYAFENYNNEPVYEGEWNWGERTETEHGTIRFSNFGPADPEDMEKWETEVRDVFNAKVREGIDLFAKHFNNLWW